jgi:hypothetical protein
MKNWRLVPIDHLIPFVMCEWGRVSATPSALGQGWLELVNRTFASQIANRKSQM